MSSHSPTSSIHPTAATHVILDLQADPSPSLSTPLGIIHPHLFLHSHLFSSSLVPSSNSSRHRRRHATLPVGDAASRHAGCGHPGTGCVRPSQRGTRPPCMGTRPSRRGTRPPGTGTDARPSDRGRDLPAGGVDTQEEKAGNAAFAAWRRGTGRRDVLEFGGATRHGGVERRSRQRSMVGQCGVLRPGGVAQP
jgi:hypothetical protein